MGTRKTERTLGFLNFLCRSLEHLKLVTRAYLVFLVRNYIFKYYFLNFERPLFIGSEIYASVTHNV